MKKLLFVSVVEPQRLKEREGREEEEEAVNQSLLSSFFFVTFVSFESLW